MTIKENFAIKKSTDSEVQNSILQTKTKQDKKLENLYLLANQEEIVVSCFSNAKVKQDLSQMKI